MSTDIDTAEDEDLCPGCEDIDAEHTCGYVNDDCPDQCAMEHDMEEEYVSQCPVTGHWWRYCCECGWEPTSRYADDPIYILGHGYLCDPYMHGYSRCYGCDSWADEDVVYYSERRNAYYCDSCYQDHRGGREGEYVGRAPCCGSLNVHLDLYTESFVCDCRAAAAMATHGAVELAHALPAAA